MNLYNAAKRFNTQLAADAYTGGTFMCQFEPMSFSKVDGVSIENDKSALNQRSPSRRGGL